MQCDWVFRLVDYLKIYELLYIDELFFKCSYCEGVFKLRYYFKKYMWEYIREEIVYVYVVQ